MCLHEKIIYLQTPQTSVQSPHLIQTGCKSLEINKLVKTAMKFTLGRTVTVKTQYLVSLFRNIFITSVVIVPNGRDPDTEYN